jgi:hypothetical protein
MDLDRQGLTDFLILFIRPDRKNEVRKRVQALQWIDLLNDTGGGAPCALRETVNKINIFH